jgi:hypothetical protein
MNVEIATPRGKQDLEAPLVNLSANLDLDCPEQHVRDCARRIASKLEGIHRSPPQPLDIHVMLCDRTTAVLMGKPVLYVGLSIRSPRLPVHWLEFPVVLAP